MSKFCEMNGNINHIAEVSTSRKDGSPTGAKILTSTNINTGDVRDTLDGKFAKMDSQFDSAFWQYVYKNGGDWGDAPAQITDAEKLTYWTVANGDGYAVKGSVTLPIAKPASPLNDDNWFIANAVNVTKMRTDSASQLGLVYLADWATGLVIPDGAMTAKLAVWHDGQFYSVSNDAGFTSNDFADDLGRGWFVSANLTTQIQQWCSEGDIRGWGAKCDYILSDGSINPNPTDDTDSIAACQRDSMIVKFPVGKTTYLREIRINKSYQVFDCTGAGLYTYEDFYILDGAVSGCSIIKGSYDSPIDVQSTFFNASGLPSVGNGTVSCNVSGCNVATVHNGLILNNGRDIVFDDVRIDCVNAINYLNKSAEVVISNSLFSSAEWAGRPNVGVGLYCANEGDGYPEGLNMVNTLLYRFKYNFDIRDLFSGIFIGNSFDCDGTEKPRISYPRTIKGVTEVGHVTYLKFSNNWWHKQAPQWGDGSLTNPRNLHSKVSFDSYTAMSEGTDVIIEKFIHGVSFNSVDHGCDGAGTHIGYVCVGNNNKIKITNPSFENYDSYAQMKGTGEFNSIANIINADNLAIPVTIEYPVDVKNVDGFYLYDEITVLSGSYIVGSEIIRKNETFSSGNVNVSLELSSITAPSEVFLTLRFVDAGTSNVNKNVKIGDLASTIRIAKQETSLRISVNAIALKAVNCDVELKVLSGGTLETSGFADGVLITQ